MALREREGEKFIGTSPSHVSRAAAIYPKSKACANNPRASFNAVVLIHDGILLGFVRDFLSLCRRLYAMFTVAPLFCSARLMNGPSILLMLVISK